MSITTNPAASESRDAMLAELNRALEEISHASSSPARRGEAASERENETSGQKRRIFPAWVAERLPLSGTLRLSGLVVVLAVTCIGIITFAWPTSSSRVTKPTIPLSISAPVAEAGAQQQSVQAKAAPEPAPAASITPELTQWDQAIARELANLEQGIEQLKARQVQLAQQNAELAGRLKETQDQMAQRDAELTERLKTMQESMARDNLSFADQLKASQDQIAGIGEQLKASAAPKQPPRAPKATSQIVSSPAPNVIATTKPAAKPKPPQTGQLPKNSTQSKPKQP